MSELNIVVIDVENAYARSEGVVFTTKKTTGSTPVVTHTGGQEIAEWGAFGYNLFPQDVIEDKKKIIELSTGINFYTFALVGSGICYGYIKVDEEGNEKPVRVFEPEVENFLQQNHLFDHQVNLAYNFKLFWNVFVEFVISQDRSKIVGFKTHKSHQCRFERMNGSGIIPSVYIQSDWESKGAKADTTLRIPLVDKFMGVESLKLRKDSNKYIYSVAGPGSEDYYQIAPWNALRESLWLDVVKSIPRFKKAIMDNQMLIRYHVQIPDYFWRDKFPGWDGLLAEEKEEKQKSTYKSIIDFLTGTDNAGKNLITSYKYDEAIQKALPGVIITPIQNQTFSGEYLQDSAEGSQKIYHALEIDSTLVGTLPGKGQSAGSGSDKSVAWNLQMAKTRGEQAIQLQPLDFVAQYNGWSEKYKSKGGLRFWYKNDYMARLMDVPPAKREAGNGTN